MAQRRAHPLTGARTGGWREDPRSRRLVYNQSTPPDGLNARPLTGEQVGGGLAANAWLMWSRGLHGLCLGTLPTCRPP